MRARMKSLARRRRARLIAAIAVAGAAIALGAPAGISQGDAADRFVAGGPVTDRSPVAADRAAASLALAAAFRSRVGLPEPATSRVERVVDRFDGTAYDEVTASDGAGQPVHVARFDARGRLVGAVAFGWQVAGGPTLANAAAARARGDRLAADLGLEPSGTPDVRQAPDETGWILTWPRLVDGVPVLGDGVRVDLWPDGRMHAIVRTERSLAARPATTLDEATARTRATATLGTIFGGRAGQVRIASIALGWVPRTARSTRPVRTHPAPRSALPGSRRRAPRATSRTGCGR